MSMWLTNFRSKKIPLWFYLSVLILLGVAGVALGAEPKYTPLVGIPGVANSGARSLSEYLNALYLLSISIGALYAVVKISLAGVKYSMSGSGVTDKQEAKDDIKGVLLGLLILLIPFIVLSTINPNLVKLNILNLDDKYKVKLLPSGPLPDGVERVPGAPSRLLCSRLTNLDPGQTCQGWCEGNGSRYEATPEPACIVGAR